jgi:hypothetical protein
MLGLPFSMRTGTDTVKHWLMRAAEARSMADSITDPVAKQTMLSIAASYEKLANRAARSPVTN